MRNLVFLPSLKFIDKSPSPFHAVANLKEMALEAGFEELDEAVKGPAYDPNDEYSVSYFWGTVGIVYDKTKVDIADLEEQGYGIFLNEKYKGDIYLYDSERDSFMMALKDLGYSMNTESEEELQEAYEWLIRQRETMDPIYAGDDVIDNMVSGNKDLAVVYSGDGAFHEISLQE